MFDIQATARKNHLLYGDNLTIMRNMPSMSVDLIYLDPPFNSQRNYNLIYKKLTGQPVPEQEEAFCDAWELDAEKDQMARDMPAEFRKQGVDEDIVAFWTAWINALRHTQPRLLAYLVYMSYRLLEMKRILKPSGSIYLHCDPTASHYIKVIMDGIFGHQNFRNEIIWQRTSAHSSAKRFGPNFDTILLYTKSDAYIWNSVKVPHDPAYIERFYRHEDERGRYTLSDLTAAGTRNGSSGLAWKGVDPTPIGRHWAVPAEAMAELISESDLDAVKPSSQEKLDLLDKAGRIAWPPGGTMPRYKRYLDEVKDGQSIQAIWTDIPPIGAQASERLGYPTQKPIKLLSRIIEASSNETGVVFDPFCGCGTSIYAAHLLGRKWIGCDIAILSIHLVRDVLLKRYGLSESQHYDIDGIPLSVDGAQDLLSRDPRQFQHWAVELAGGFASTKHSGDLGIDGRIHFETKDGLKNMVISVKGGKLTPAFMRELRGVYEREGSSEMGGLICLQPPTRGMKDEASQGGIYSYLGTDYDRIQIRTIEELLAGRGFHTPSRVRTLDWVKAVQPALF